MIRIPPVASEYFRELLKGALSLLSAHPVLETLPVCWNMPLCSLQDPETRRAFKERFGKGERDMIVPAGRTGIPHICLSDSELERELSPDDSAEDLTEGLDTSSVPFFPHPDPFGYRPFERYRSLAAVLLAAGRDAGLSRNEAVGELAVLFFEDQARFIPVTRIGTAPCTPRWKRQISEPLSPEILLLEWPPHECFNEAPRKHAQAIFRQCGGTSDGFLGFTDWISRIKAAAAEIGALDTPAQTAQFASISTYQEFILRNRDESDSIRGRILFPTYTGDSEDFFRLMETWRTKEAFGQERGEDAGDEESRRVLTSDMPGEVEMEGENCTVRFIHGRAAGLYRAERRITPALPIISSMRIRGVSRHFDRAASYSIEEEGLRGLREIRVIGDPSMTKPGKLTVDYLFRDNDPLLYVSVEMRYPIFAETTVVEHTAVFEMAISGNRSGEPFTVNGIREAGSVLRLSIGFTPSPEAKGSLILRYGRKSCPGNSFTLYGREFSLIGDAETITIGMDPRDRGKPGLFPVTFRAEKRGDEEILWMSIGGLPGPRTFRPGTIRRERFSFCIGVSPLADTAGLAPIPTGFTSERQPFFPRFDRLPRPLLLMEER